MDIRGILGAHLATGGSSKVEKEINRLYDQYFTGKGKLKKGKDAPPSTKLRDELANRIDYRDSVERAYNLFQQTSDEVERSCSLTAESETKLKQIESALDKAERDEKEFLELKAKKDKYGKEAELYENKHNNLRKTIDQIRNSETELVNKEKEIENYRKDKGLKQTELDTAALDEKSCLDNLTLIKQDDIRIGNIRIMSDDARNFSETSGTLQELEVRFQRISGLLEKTGELKKAQTEFQAPTEAALKAIAEAIVERDCTRIKIDA